MLRRTLLATAALGLGLMTAGGALAAGMDKVKACFVYVGPIGDGGWTYQHHQGALELQKTYGDKVEVPVTCRLDTAEEVSIYEAGGVLQRFAKDFLESRKAA